MRLRARLLPASADGPPAMLLIGTCMEVWSCDGEVPHFSAVRAHRAARLAWAKAHGLGAAEMCRLMPAGGPWSVEFLIAEGRRAEVVERLVRAGVTIADIPELRAAALMLRDRT